MNILNEVVEPIEIEQLRHLRVDYNNREYIASLVDLTGFEVVRGYGKTVIEAINDLHAGFV